MAPGLVGPRLPHLNVEGAGPPALALPQTAEEPVLVLEPRQAGGTTGYGRALMSPLGRPFSDSFRTVVTRAVDRGQYRRRVFRRRRTRVGSLPRPNNGPALDEEFIDRMVDHFLTPAKALPVKKKSTMTKRPSARSAGQERERN